MLDLGNLKGSNGLTDRPYSLEKGDHILDNRMGLLFDVTQDRSYDVNEIYMPLTLVYNSRQRITQ